MARFPKREDEIHALINRMISGYEAYPAEFPNADPVGLRVVRDEYENYKVGQLCKEAWAHLATEAKDQALEALVFEMESQLKQSEVDTSGDAKELELLGWSDREIPEPANAPGQPRLLEIVSEGAGTIDLDWKAPGPGPFGPPRTYVILRRMESPTGWTPWQDTTIAIQTRATLTNQPLRTQLEYRVIAMNNAGTSIPSNSVAAVL